MRTGQIDQIQSASLQIEGIPSHDLELIKIEQPQARRFLSCFIKPNHSSKAINQYIIRIHTQKGYDDLVRLLHRSQNEELPFVCQLDIGFRPEQIDLNPIFEAFPTIRQLLLETNQNIPISELVDYPNLKSLIFSDLSIYWNPGEKNQLLNNGKAKDLSIYLASFSYSFNHLTSETFQLLKYLLNTLLILTIIEYSISSKRTDFDPYKPDPDRLPIIIFIFACLRCLLSYFWTRKDMHESLEKTRTIKE